MTDKQMLKAIRSMHNITAEKTGLSKAKIVTVRKDRRCFCCGETITKGTKSITASHMIDKKKGMMLKDLYDMKSFDVRQYKFVPERHWVCLDCTMKNIKIPSKIEEYFDFELINLDDYDYNTQLELIVKAFDYGQITLEEYDNMERAIIDAIALEEAVGIGQS